MHKFIFLWFEAMMMSPFLILPIMFYKDAGAWIFLLWIPVPMFAAIIYSIAKD